MLASRRPFTSSPARNPRQKAWFMEAAKRRREDMPIELERELEGEDSASALPEAPEAST